MCYICETYLTTLCLSSQGCVLEMRIWILQSALYCEMSPASSIPLECSSHYRQSTKLEEHVQCMNSVTNSTDGAHTA